MNEIDVIFNELYKDVLLPSKENIKDAMQKYARLMCDKQRQICYSQLKNCGGINENEFDGDMFLNSPYPEELL